MDKGKKEGHLSHEEIAEKLQNFEMDWIEMDDFFDQLNDNDITLVNEKIVLTRMIKSILMI
ncbi:hypothetical protein J4714_09585 [Staphylococcus epidermidis]|nr:hypothetical protein [Staphylococcus epidermidis]